ncbi:MAG: hypothetical protein KKA19_03825 [Candidatus Margulisbacteria bacterium]|nr:hypothetical protein [Candidatus Margulisiibacteriota bacterium]
MRTLYLKYIASELNDSVNFFRTPENIPSKHNLAYTFKYIPLSSIKKYASDTTLSLFPIFNIYSFPRVESSCIVNNFVSIDFKNPQEYLNQDTLAQDIYKIYKSPEKQSAIANKLSSCSSEKSKGKAKENPTPKNIKETQMPLIISSAKYLNNKPFKAAFIPRVLITLAQEDINSETSSAILNYLVYYQKEITKDIKHPEKEFSQISILKTDSKTALENTLIIINQIKKISSKPKEQVNVFFALPLISFSDDLKPQKITPLKSSAVQEVEFVLDDQDNPISVLEIAPVNPNATPVAKKTVSPLEFSFKENYRRENIISPVERRGEAGDRHREG